MNQEISKALTDKIGMDCKNAAGVVVQKDGERVFEAAFHGCSASSRVHVYSVTKSVLSILIGIAIDKRYIKSVDQKVLDFFPGYAIKRGEKTIRQIALRDLLTMTAPYKYRPAPLAYMRYFMSRDWVKFSLDALGGGGKIGAFRYAPLVGPDILSGILTKATGQSVLGFATEQLFSPLGIPAHQTIVFHSAREQRAFNRSTDLNGWAADARGTNAAGWGLALSPLDMAAIGQLLLNGGVWNGEQLVSARWAGESTRAHSRWEETGRSYGYLWWITDAGFAAMGDGGNVIYVNRDKKLVVAMTSFFEQNVADRIEWIQAFIEPLF